ncbi:ribonuclease HI family protein [Candidatus Margulisiibacteriota bacterium]
MAIKVHIDGASRGNPGDASIGVVIKDGDKVLGEIGAYIGKTTNNVAEYLSLIRGLEEVLTRGHKKADFFSDSELLVKQLSGEYRVKNEGLIPLHYHILSLIERMDSFSIKHVTRDKNAHADKLANQALDIHLKAGLPLFKKTK